MKDLERSLRRVNDSGKESLKNEIRTVREKIATNREEIDVTKRNIHSLRESSSTVRMFGRDISKSTINVTKAMGNHVAKTIEWNTKLGKGVDQLLTDYRKSLSTGLSVDYITSMTMGLTQEAFLSISSENRRTMEAFNREGRIFTDRLKEVSWGLVQYTGSLEQANKFAAGLETSVRTLGLYGDAATSYSNTLNKTFKQFNSSLSMTNEAFLNLVNNIHSDNEVRKVSARMASGERAEFSQSINQLMGYFARLGYNENEIANLTKEFIKTFKADDPKEFYKQTMKEVALAGAMGLSQQDIEFRARTATMSPNELAANADRILAFQERLGGRVGEGLNQGPFGSRLAAAHLRTRLGNEGIDTGNLLRMQREVYGGGIDIDKLSADLDRSRNDTLVKMLTSLDGIRGILNNAPAMIGAAVASTILSRTISGKFLGGGGGKFGRGGGGGRGFGGAGGAGRGVMGVLSKGAWPLAAGLGAYQLSQMDWGDKEKMGDNMTEAGGLAGSLAFGAIGAYLGSVVPVVGTIAGGIIGAIVGGVGGSQLTSALYDKFSKAIDNEKELEERRVAAFEKYRDTAFALERASELAYNSAVTYDDIRGKMLDATSPSYKTDTIVAANSDITKRRTGEELYEEAFKRQSFSNRLTHVDGFKIREAYESFGAGEKEMAAVARKIAEERSTMSKEETEKFVEQLIAGLLKGKAFHGELVSFGKDKTSPEIEVLKAMYEEFKSMNSNMEQVAKIAREERDRELLEDSGMSVVESIDSVLRRHARNSKGPLAIK